jgi:DUF1680 family protein
MLMKNYSAVTFDKVDITDGFWAQKQKLVRDVSVRNVYNRFKETGRFDAFRMEWKEGDPNKPHIFWDSDIAKWIETVAFLCEKQREPELEAITDEVVDLIEKNRDPSGYFNIYFTVCEPEARFTRRPDHELYDAGHLMEAAVAYYKATGKDKFLRLMCDYADWIEKCFVIDKTAKFVTPGHEEIELALVKLYECTGERRYLELSKFFIDNRGKVKEETYDWAQSAYNQSHAPVREQRTAEGHSVRAVYLYSGMADIARECGDETLFEAADAIFDNIKDKRMYITGGIGSAAQGEQFTVDYDLPNKHAYAESCAALGLALFARRMLRLNADSKYADVIERVIYNGFLSSISLDGKSFFYENPLEVDMYLHNRNKKMGFGHFPPPHRFEVFGCSCCPPNITRFIASLGDMMYTYDDDTVFVHQYIHGDATFDRCGENVTITQRTGYPYDGVVGIGWHGAPTRLALRIPGWCESFTLTKNSLPVAYEMKNGYAVVDAADGDNFTLALAMEVRLTDAHPNVQNNACRVAVERGPLVFCAEGVDNPSSDPATARLHDIRLIEDAGFDVGFDNTLGVITLETDALRTCADEAVPNSPLYRRHTSIREPVRLRLIPYYAFANRGDTDMLVWFNI